MANDIAPTRINPGRTIEQPVRFGDDITGTQALENKNPLITNDKALKRVINDMSGTTR